MDNNYLTPTNVYEEAIRRYESLKRARQRVERNLKSHPPGKLHIVKSKKRIQYYVRYDSKDKSGKYLPKHEKEKIKRYLQKKYDEEVLKLIVHEINNLEKFLNDSQLIEKKIQSKYSDYPSEIKDYINPVDVSNEDYTKWWMSKPYIGKEIGSSVPEFITDRGEHVRSKSELNICNQLYKLNIPYKYECPLVLSNGKTIYPDITVLDIRTRREIYWEHRGMMDDREYVRHTVLRIKDYENEGIYLGDKLIITEETSNIALGINEIKNVIRHYFK